jgi:thymidine kinase
MGDSPRIAPVSSEFRRRMAVGPVIKRHMDVVRTPAAGWIEVVVGSMFSGKSEELIRRLRRAQIARQRVQIFKPAVDTRYGDDHIVSHSELRIPSERASSAHELLRKVAPTPRWSASTKGSSSTWSCLQVCTTLAEPRQARHRRGLDQDYLGKPFEPMPHLLAIAEYITKTRAICMVCGNPANHTQRLVGTSDRVLLGAQGTYEARCRRCFDGPGRGGREAPAGCRRWPALAARAAPR